MTTNTDQYYIQKILSGEVNAYTFLVDKYKRLIYTLALRMVGNEIQAEEIAQDTFVKAYSALHKYKGDAKFSTWLYKIAYNTSLDYVKKNKRRVASYDDEYRIHDTEIEHVEDALQQMIAAERKASIAKAIQQLTAEESTLITLYYYEELSIKEIAAIVGITRDNVKIKLFRSRKKLFVILKPIIAITPRRHG